MDIPDTLHKVRNNLSTVITSVELIRMKQANNQDLTRWLDAIEQAVDACCIALDSLNQ